MTVLHALRAFFQQLSSTEIKTYWIAFSGGMDSHVLLSACSELRAELHLDLRAIYVNHHLSPHATTWGLHCKNVCQALAIPFVEGNVQLDMQAGDSLEEKAREKRYAIFAEYVAEQDVLLTAHHQDDQAETLLLQLMRGAGVKGLAAMPEIKPFAKGWQARPFLALSRKVLQAYADSLQLQWIEDESNLNLAFTRNFIRHEVIPLLQSRWPAATTAIARSAQHCAENEAVLQDYAAQQYKQVQGTRANTLSVTKLLQFNAEQQRHLLRSWIHETVHSLPNTKKMASIQRDVLCAAWDSSPIVQWGNVMLRRHRDDIYLLPLIKAFDTSAEFVWALDQPLLLPNASVLKTIPSEGKGLRADINNVVIRFRQGGEVLEIPARGRHTLKNLLQEWNVLPWERAHLPLIYVADKLIAVAGYFLHADYVAKKDEMGREIVFE